MPQIIAGIGAWFAGLSPLTAALVKIGGSLLLSAASKALMPRPDVGLSGRTLTVREPVAPRELVYGRARKGGTIIYIGTRNQNQYLDLVIVLAAHRVKKIGAIYFDGELAIADGSVYASGRWGNFLAGVERATGDDNQTAFPGFAAFEPLWTANHRLRGCAAIRVTMTWNQDAFPRGIPNITADIEGKDDVLDPRSGMRGYSENPALCLADYMSLVSFGIGAQIGAPDGTAEATLIASANVCDETVARVGGGAEPRYSCNGVVSLALSPKAIIEAMLTSMAGTCGWQGGQWHIYAGAYRIPVDTLTADDVASGGMVLQTRVSRSENFNAVRGQFVSPENDWQQDDFPAYASAVYLAEDGGEQIWRDIALPFTISASMAQRLAKIALERNRRQMSIGLTGKLSAWRITVGDTVNVTYDRWGMAAKPFDVQGVSLTLQTEGDTPRMVPDIQLRETSPLIYDWTASEFQIYQAAPRTTLPSAFDIDPPGIPVISEALYRSRGGVGLRSKAIVIWGPTPTATVSQYQLDYRTAGGAWLTAGRTDQTSMEISDLAPGDWEFRVKAMNVIAVSSAWAGASATLYGLAAPPVQLANVTLQSAGGTAILKWDLHPDLDVRDGGNIVIRHSSSGTPAWTNSVSMDVVSGDQAIAAVPLKPGTYLLRAEDAQGIPGPAVLVPASGAQVLAFTTLSTLTENAGFTGTKTKTVAAAGVLSLDSSLPIDSWANFDAVANIDIEGGIEPTGTYDFATVIDLGTAKRVRLQSEIDLNVLNLAATIDVRPGDIDTWANFDGADGSEVDVTVEAQLTQTDPAGSPVWTAWSRVDSAEVLARGVRARAVLRSFDPAFNPAVTILKLKADEVI